MAVGGSAVNFINKVLDHLRGGTTWTQPTGLWMQLHVGDPGPAGTANPSAVTTRQPVTFGVAASGAISQSGTAPVFTATASETISHVSYKDAATAGNFIWSEQCSVPKGVVVGDIITHTTGSLGIGPLAG